MAPFSWPTGWVSQPGGKWEKSSRKRILPDSVGVDGCADDCTAVADCANGSRILCESVAPATAAPFLRKARRSIWTRAIVAAADLIRLFYYLALLTSLPFFNRDLPFL